MLFCLVLAAQSKHKVKSMKSYRQLVVFLSYVLTARGKIICPADEDTVIQYPEPGFYQLKYSSVLYKDIYILGWFVCFF